MRMFIPSMVVGALAAAAIVPSAYAQSNSTAVWQVSTAQGGRQVAAIRSAGSMRGMSITCQGSAPMLLVAAPQNGKSTKAKLELTGTVDGSTINVPMIWNPQSSAWWAILTDRAALDLLAGASNSVFMAMNGVAIGTLPLTGSSNAIRTALAGCYVPPAATVATGGAAGAGSKNSLPLRFGTYARVGKKCGADENTQAFIDVGTGGAGDPLAGGGIESMRKTGANTYAVREDVGVQDTSVITATYSITDHEHFTVKSKDYGTKNYGYCPLESLPLDQQRWPQGEWKQVASLPVKFGYYQAWTDMNGDGRMTCDHTCSYYLFRSDGIAAVSYGSDNPEIYRRALRQPRITQTGALTYNVMSRTDENESFSFAIRSPTDFVEPDEMMGDTVFRAVDPAKIPAKYMPRL